MKYGKRNTVKAALALGVSVVFGTHSPWAISTTSSSDMFLFSNLEQPQMVYTGYPTRPEFEELIKSRFLIDMGPYQKPLKIKLTDVIDISNQAFVLKFETSDSRKLPQDTYLIQHDLIGPIPIFLGSNPVNKRRYLEAFRRGGKQKKSRRYFYEAVFNLLPEDQ